MFTAGCAKVNCGKAARKGALGYNSAHRFYPVCTI